MLFPIKNAKTSYIPCTALPITAIPTQCCCFIRILRSLTLSDYKKKYLHLKRLKLFRSKRHDHKPPTES